MNLKFYDLIEKPKPCPFCGNQTIDIRKRKTVIIECKNCSALFIQMTVDGAVAAWNRRVMTNGEV